MSVSPEKLVAESEATGFRADVLKRPSTCWDCSTPSAVIRS